jgi:thiol:disulfide interchange protein DsbD
VDFTAEWCLNCKALEHGVLHRQEIVELLNGPGVSPMRIDLTGDNPLGKAKLVELEWVGIPLLAIYGPGIGYDDPIKYDSYTVGMVRDAVERAGGR